MKLTPYQIRLCRLRFAGSTNQEIADSLSKSVNTINSQFRVIHKILNLKKWTDFYREWPGIQAELISPNDDM